ncbi:hypothetical protein NEPAR06_2053 [Nematocida parisii]|nr:hypothetical protein NEPAR03_1737 [Nematocida parisii]KAI5130653.1 hypothetical protein NEPAR08_2162 [Nematocida parisii]KAI5144440.1 hypothetical protein NEPAR04_2082 [Nematocida parisii]KAI5155843.1 hypothetical protein NEPAR06_2053 [Nematocida parisii]KAI5156641.1 hypothetical protein NEPAR05_0708 [Nematocida parisii]
MYSQQKRQEEGKSTLPLGEEFEALIKRLNSGQIEERVKIAIAGKYFSVGDEDSYKRVIETVSVKSTEDHTLKNNQDIMISLIRYNKTQEIIYLNQAKDLITKTHIFPTIKTMFLLATESSQDEILKEAYKLNRNCKYSAQLKAISFINSKKYEEASSIIERLPASIEKTLLELVAVVFLDANRAKEVYSRFEDEFKKEKEKERSNPERLDTYIEYAKRLVEKGSGVGIDLIVSEIAEALKTTSGVALGSAKHLVEQTAKNPQRSLDLLSVSKRLLLEVEILRAEALLSKKRYMEVMDLAQSLKSSDLPIDESASERIAIILISSAIIQNKTEQLDVPWIVNALSKREQIKKDIGLSDLVELIKSKEPSTPSLEGQALLWAQKMIKLSKNEHLIWKPVIEESKYLNRLGNIYFSQKKIEEAIKAYNKALELSTEAQATEVQENIDMLKQWISRKEPILSECPEVMCLFKSLGYTSDNPSTIEYINNAMRTELKIESVGLLEEIAKELSKNISDNTGTERVLNILSLCSLVKFKKSILTATEISESNISVIYNHILFWCNENTQIDTDVANAAIEWYTSKYSTASQKLVAKHAVLLVMTNLSKSGSVKEFNEIFMKVKDHIKEDTKDLERITEMKLKLEEINSPIDEDKSVLENIEVPLETANKKETEPKQQQPTVKNSSELLSKREEVMRMLTETGPGNKKSSKKSKRTRPDEEEEKPAKRQKIKQEDKEERKPRNSSVKKPSSTAVSSDDDETASIKKHKVKAGKERKSEEPEPVAIKRASHTVLSSDEED